jgi:hypothetical protein
VLVDNAVKVLPKKRKHQMTHNLIVTLSKASLLKYQALWYSVFIAVYIWFLYWVCYDFFVWQKPITEINAVNYVGAIAAIAFIWAGTKLLKRDRIKADSPQQKLLPQKPIQKPIPQKPPQQKLKPLQKAAATTTATTATNSTCPHYLGYLKQRQKSQEIPAACLTCEKLIQCMSSTS